MHVIMSYVISSFSNIEMNIFILSHSAPTLLITQLNPDILEFVFPPSSKGSPLGHNLHTKSKYFKTIRFSEIEL